VLLFYAKRGNSPMGAMLRDIFGTERCADHGNCFTFAKPVPKKTGHIGEDHTGAEDIRLLASIGATSMKFHSAIVKGHRSS
jgi:hypothetical protein